jgi:hypothetical protein
LGVSATDAEIERLSRRRQEIWFGYEQAPAGEAARLGRSIAALFEEKRTEEARGQHGPADIAKRARVEAELERLMTA